MGPPAKQVKREPLSNGDGNVNVNTRGRLPAAGNKRTDKPVKQEPISEDEGDELPQPRSADEGPRTYRRIRVQNDSDNSGSTSSEESLGKRKRQKTEEKSGSNKKNRRDSKSEDEYVPLQSPSSDEDPSDGGIETAESSNSSNSSTASGDEGDKVQKRNNTTIRTRSFLRKNRSSSNKKKAKANSSTKNTNGNKKTTKNSARITRSSRRNSKVQESESSSDESEISCASSVDSIHSFIVPDEEEVDEEEDVETPPSSNSEESEINLSDGPDTRSSKNNIKLSGSRSLRSTNQRSSTLRNKKPGIIKTRKSIRQKRKPEKVETRKSTAQKGKPVEILLSSGEDSTGSEYVELERRNENARKSTRLTKADNDRSKSKTSKPIPSESKTSKSKISKSNPRFRTRKLVGTSPTSSKSSSSSSESDDNRSNRRTNHMSRRRRKNSMHSPEIIPKNTLKKKLSTTSDFIQDPVKEREFCEIDSESEDSFIDNNTTGAFANLESSSSSDSEVPEEADVLDLNPDHFEIISSSSESEDDPGRDKSQSDSSCQSCENGALKRSRTGFGTGGLPIIDRCAMCENLGETDFHNRDQQEEASWCECGHCKVVSPKMENYDRICCKEIIGVTDFMEDELNDDIHCITQHPRFKQDVLEYGGYLRSLKTRKGNKDSVQQGELAKFNRATVTDNQKVFMGRYSFIRWIFNRIGWDNRMVVPACVINKIRKKHIPSAGPLYFDSFSPKKTCEYGKHCVKAKLRI